MVMPMYAMMVNMPVRKALNTMKTANIIKTRFLYLILALGVNETYSRPANDEK